MVALAGFLHLDRRCGSGTTRRTPDFQLVERARVDPVDRRGVFPRRRRHQHAADPADDADGLHRGAGVVDGDHRAREGVLLRLLVLQTGMLGAFMSLDFLLFFLFWEVMLVPMYFLIGIWGSANRLYSAIKFFLYTLVGSVVMLLGILALYFHNTAAPASTPSTSRSCRSCRFPSTSSGGSSSRFSSGFAIKVPMFPFHTWLPDAHTDAPTAGSVILAAVLLKMGTYGFLRFSLPMLPGGDTSLRSVHRGAVDHRHRLRRARRARAEGLEAAGRLFVGQPHGHGDARHVRAESGRHDRQRDPADQPRHLDRRAVPARRHRLRAAAHARDLRIRRAVEGDAGRSPRCS